MKFIFLLNILTLFCLPSFAAADLTGDIKAILADKYLANTDVGIAIAKLGEQADATEVIYRFDGDIPLIPASNLKVLTTSAFLDHFGADFKFRTSLLGKDGDLYLIGDGDPTLGDVELLKKVGWDVDTVFKNWAEELKKRGITSIRNVFVDDSVFDEQFIPPNWLPRYAHERYSAGVGGVNLNANCVDFLIRATGPRQLVDFVMDPNTQYITVKNQCISGGDDNVVGLVRTPGKNDVTLRGQIKSSLNEPISVTIHDPPMFAATVLAETFAKNGVTVTGSVARDRTANDRRTKDPAGWAVVATLETKLSTVLDRANKDSMNLYAESLCKRLGRAISGQPGSWTNGPAAVTEFLKRIGVPEKQFHIDDGSGLSRENNASADALLKVLTYNFHGKNRAAFVNSLAVAGEDGTFDKRFKGNLRGRVFGKSGYVIGVSAISGYLKARDDSWYAFSIMMNNVPQGTNSSAKIVQERIIAAIDENASKKK